MNNVFDKYSYAKFKKFSKFKLQHNKPIQIQIFIHGQCKSWYI
jgi:hypothetical protein